MTGDDRHGAVGEGDDRELVAAYLLLRREGAFRALYRRHTPRLYQLSLRVLSGDRRDAEEAVQETWIRAAERLEAFAWRSSLGTWLTGIAINVCRDRLRHDRARPRLTAVEGPETIRGAGSSPRREADGTEPGNDRRLDLERAIGGLPARYRQVLVLHDVEGYTHREIGRFLDIEAGTSKSQLFHARKAMRQRLGAEK